MSPTCPPMTLSMGPRGREQAAESSTESRRFGGALGERGSCLTISRGALGPGLEGVQLVSAAPFLTACRFRLGGGPRADVGRLSAGLALSRQLREGQRLGGWDSSVRHSPFLIPTLQTRCVRVKGPLFTGFRCSPPRCLPLPAVQEAALRLPEGSPHGRGLLAPVVPRLVPDQSHSHRASGLPSPQ